jgi:hypothetical protein
VYSTRISSVFFSTCLEPPDQGNPKLRLPFLGPIFPTSPSNGLFFDMKAYEIPPRTITRNRIDAITIPAIAEPGRTFLDEEEDEEGDEEGDGSVYVREGVDTTVFD